MSSRCRARWRVAAAVASAGFLLALGAASCGSAAEPAAEADSGSAVPLDAAPPADTGAADAMAADASGVDATSAAHDSGPGGDAARGTDTAPSPDAGPPPEDLAGPGPGDLQPDVAGDPDTGPSCDPAGLVLPVYPHDQELRINQLQAKGTHNSYHTASELDVPHWAYEQQPLGVQLGAQGVRQVELDVHYEPEIGFTVYHIAHLDPGTTCERFVECLADLRAWSDCHPGHHLIVIGVEPKDDVDRHKIIGHYAELEAEVLQVWPAERLLTPDRVRGDHDSLREALLADGWPTLGATRGQAMLLLLDSGEHRDAYLQEYAGLRGALFFTRNGQGLSWSSFLEVGDPRGREDEIRQAVRDGYLVRSVADEAYLSDEENALRAQAALEAGAHFISSDIPAPVPGRGYSFEIPEGVPSRCNPVSGPIGCRPVDIEALPVP